MKSQFMKSKIKILIILLGAVYSLNSCITNKQTDLLQDIKKNYPTIMPESYKIIAGDQLTITVYAWDPKTAQLFASYTPSFVSERSNEGTTVQTGTQLKAIERTSNIKPINVYADGTITFPYIGKIYVQDLTLLEARQVISDKLNAFAEGTTADVTLANRYFSVLGEGGARRITMNNTSMTIYQALAIANPIPPYADKSKVSIIRQDKDGSSIKTFDLRSKDIIDTEYYYIQPNDVIYFPQMKRKFLGSTTSFVGLFGLVTSFAGIIVFTVRFF